MISNINIIIVTNNILQKICFYLYNQENFKYKYTYDILCYILL